MIIPAAVVLMAAITLLFWIGSEPDIELEERVPGTDNVVGEEPASQSNGDVFSGKLLKGDGVPAKLSGAWPRFRGKDFDAVNKENIPLARQWSQGQPEVIWGIDTGEGYAAAAVLNGRVYLLDYDATQQEDVLRCMSLADGKDIWRYSYPVQIKRNHGMSRTIPAVTDRYVVSLGPMCHVLCLDSGTGEFRWAFDLVKQFGTVVPEWYAGQCPLIDNSRAIIAPGGTDTLMMAVELSTGDIVWKTPNPDGWNMTHSSIIPMDFAGHRMYIYCASGGVVGVAAEDGSVLWKTTDWRISIATVPSPVLVGEGRIFICGGYNSGSIMLQLKEQKGGIAVETVYRLKPKIFGSDQQTPVFYKGNIYGVRPDKQLVCLSLEGKILWASGSNHRFGLGPYMIADGMIFLMENIRRLCYRVYLLKNFGLI